MKRIAFLLKSFVTMVLLGWSLMSHAQGYEIDRDRVYFGEEVMMQADARSFVDLGCGYAKDRRNVYLNGRVLEFVDPSTFRLKRGSRHHEHEDIDAVAQRGYYKTQFNVYYGNKKIDAQAATFVELGSGYAKDAFNVYYFGEKIKGSMASANFVILDDGGYAKDAFNAYYRGKKVEGAFASTFKSTGDGYAEDTFHVYYKGKKLE